MLADESRQVDKGRRARLLALFTLIHAANAVCYTGISPLSPFIEADLGFNKTQVGGIFHRRDGRFCFHRLADRSLWHPANACCRPAGRGGSYDRIDAFSRLSGHNLRGVFGWCVLQRAESMQQ